MDRITITSILLIVFLFSTTGQCYTPIFTPVKPDNNIYEEIETPINSNIEAETLFKKVSLLKDKMYLEYKDDKDLYETCEIIVNTLEKENSVFSKYDVAAIILKESRFKRTALNKKDGGKGLGQLTNINKWHKKRMPWLTHPYSKKQNIKAIVTILNDNYERFENKKIAIERYNGNCAASKRYVKDVYRVKNIIKTQNIS